MNGFSPELANAYGTGLIIGSTISLVVVIVAIVCLWMYLRQG